MESLLPLLKERRSIRRFKETPVPPSLVEEILQAGRWAPSGKNNQPWRFTVASSRHTISALSRLTVYSRPVEESQLCISVFLYKPSGYHREKDYMSIGASIQNMLLAAHLRGLGTLWLGEILKKSHEVRDLFSLSSDYELAAVIAMGYPNESPSKDRKELSQLVVYRD
jgi:nitroreductase